MVINRSRSGGIPGKGTEKMAGDGTVLVKANIGIHSGNIIDVLLQISPCKDPAQVAVAFKSPDVSADIDVGVWDTPFFQFSHIIRSIDRRKAIFIAGLTRKF